MAAARRLLSKQQEPQAALPALSLTCAFSHALTEGAEAGAFGFPAPPRHSVEECCDVAVIAIAPDAPFEEPSAEAEEDEEEGSSLSDEEEEDEEEDEDSDDLDDDDDPLFPTGGGPRRPRRRSSSRREKAQEAPQRRGQRRQQQQRQGGPKRRASSTPTLVVTACNHDAALRWCVPCLGALVGNASRWD